MPENNGVKTEFLPVKGCILKSGSAAKNQESFLEGTQNKGWTTDSLREIVRHYGIITYKFRQPTPFGKLQYWNDGVLECWEQMRKGQSLTAEFYLLRIIQDKFTHPSSIPIFQFSMCMTEMRCLWSQRHMGGILNM